MASDSDSPAFICVPCSPADEFNCAVCHKLLNEPFLSDCCGEHFCKLCIVPHLQPKSYANSTPCPRCNTATFRVMLDKSFLRKLNDLEVFCPQQSHGCEWRGRQGDMKEHMDLEAGSCDYVEVECVYKCGASLQRRNLNHHMQEECSRRPNRCQYCGYVAICEVALTEHEQTCEKFPLACPNSCEQSPIERRQLENHLIWCPLQEVECGFTAIGCTGGILRKDIQHHMQESGFAHTMLVYNFFQTTLKKLEDEVKVLKAELNNKNEAIATLEQKVFDLQQKDAQVQELQRQLDSTEQRVDTLEANMSTTVEYDSAATGYSTDGARASSRRPRSRTTPFATAPSHDPKYLFTFDLTMETLKSRSGSHWSETFYSEKPGYNMQLDVYCRNPYSSSERQLCVYVYVLHGKYDETLKWPLEATVALQLSDRTDSNDPICGSVIGIWNKVKPGMNKGEGHSVNLISKVKMEDYISDGVLRIRVLSVALGMQPE